MADVPVVSIETNGYRNVIIRATLLSDGSGCTNFKVYDASSGGAFGVTAPGGQLVYPGIHTKLIGLDYDIQDLKLRIRWEATANQDILALGNAPEDFNWRRFGGIRVPAITGATGSILLTTVDQQVNSTFSIVLYLRKGIPQS